MRSGLYRSWQWLALPAACWFAVESGLHIALGETIPAFTSAGLFGLAVGSLAAARLRIGALARISS
jgi:hypothetical protein